MYEPHEPRIETNVPTKRKLHNDHFERQHPKKVYMRKHLSNMRPDSDANSTGEACTPESTMGFKSPGSVMSELDSLSDIPSVENPDSVKDICTQPWTPLSWGGILSPGTPYSQSSIGTPKSHDSINAKPPSVGSVDYCRDEELLDLSLPPKKEYCRRNSLDSRYRINSPKYNAGEGVHNTIDREPPQNIVSPGGNRGNKFDLHGYDVERVERGPAAKYAHWDNADRTYPPTHPIGHPGDVDEDMRFRRTTLRNDSMFYDDRLYLEKLQRDKFVSPHSSFREAPIAVTSSRHTSGLDFDVSRDFGDRLYPPNGYVSSERSRSPINESIISRDFYRSHGDYSLGSRDSRLGIPISDSVLRDSSCRIAMRLDNGTEVPKYHEQSTVNNNIFPGTKYPQQTIETQEPNRVKRADAVPSLIPISAPNIEQAAARSIQQPPHTQAPVHGISSPIKLTHNGHGAVADQNGDLIIEDISDASEARDVQKLLDASQIKPEPGEPSTDYEEPTKVDVDIRFCQVCGDNAAGFHCGAYVCEACKKFFVRCIKSENLKFSCPRSMKCEVTRETRTRCQYCRYIKCISLGMYKPGGTNVSSQIAHIPCKVCGAPSSGFHFGAITCEGCKGFFRRTVKERDMQKYECSRQGVCNITTATRNICKYCRYQKCLVVGMKADGSRIGRQPNAVKHRTMLQLQEIKMAKGLPIEFQMTPHNVKSVKSEAGSPSACPTVTVANQHTPNNEETFSTSAAPFYRSASTSADMMGQNEQTNISENRKRALSLDVEPRKNQFLPDSKDSNGLSSSDMSRVDSGRNGHFTPHNSVASSTSTHHNEAICMDGLGHRATTNTAVSPSALPNGRPISPPAIHHHMTSHPVRHNSTDDNLRLSRDRLQYPKQEDIFDQRRRHSDDFVFRPDEENIRRSPHVEKPMPRFPSQIPDMRFLPPGYPGALSPVGNSAMMPPPFTHMRQFSCPYPQQLSRLPHPFLPGYTSHSARGTQNSPTHFQSPAAISLESSYERHNSQPNYIRDTSQRSLPQYSIDNLSPPLDAERSIKHVESSSQHVQSYNRPPEPCAAPYIPPVVRTKGAEPISRGTTPRLPQTKDLNEPLSRHSSVDEGSQKQGSLLRSELTRSADMPSIAQVIDQVQNAYRELMPILRRCPDIPAVFNPNCTRDDLWNIQMAQFKQCAHATVKFSKYVPGFKQLAIQDQIQRVQDCMYPVVMTVLASKYDAENQQYCYFNYTDIEEQQILTHFCWFADLIATFHVIGFPVQVLEMDNTELSFLCALKLLSECDKPQYEELLVSALEEYCRDKGDHPQTRAGLVMLRLNELARINHIHHKTVTKGADELLKCGFEIPQLFQESFLND